MEALDRCAARNSTPGRAYARRQPEKTPLYQVFQRHLPAFERMWTDTESGGCLPKFVTVELQAFLRCGILGTRNISLEAKALLSRLSAIVPPPRRHVTVYSGYGFVALELHAQLHASHNE